MAIARAGMSRYRTWVKNPDPSGGLAKTGNQSSSTQKMVNKMEAVTNSGIDELASPLMTMPRSAALSLRRAAYAPAKIAMGMVSMSARRASLAERYNALPTLG